MLIASLPPLHREPLLHEIASCPWVGGLRYNTGMVSPEPPAETARQLRRLAERYRKPLWLDLKGRQLRVTAWAAPDYGRIVLNHAVEVEGPADVYFRGEAPSTLKAARGRVIFVDPPPRHAVGEGQAVNLIGDRVTIHGYLTPADVEYVRAAREQGLRRFMLSFVEKADDVAELLGHYGESPAVAGVPRPAEVVLKIESRAGLDFAAGWPGNLPGGVTSGLAATCRLMAARDDLFLHVGPNKAAVLRATRQLVEADPQAIVASRLLSGIEATGAPSAADYSDLELLHRFGYRHFMLSDGLCHRHFAAAVRAWRDYREVGGYGGEPEGEDGEDVGGEDTDAEHDGGPA